MIISECKISLHCLIYIQQANVDTAASLIQRFEECDYISIHNWLTESFKDKSNPVENGPVWYYNGWFMYMDNSWDIFRYNIAPAAKVLILDANGLYYGSVSNDVREGSGVQCFASNDSYYSGTWVEDLPNGAGVYYKTAADGSRLEYAGQYINGYEDGDMTLTVNGSSSMNYTAKAGDRTILEVKNGSYVYAQQGDTYWCCTEPTGHGVPVDSIPYQEEFSIEIAPVVQNPQLATQSSVNEQSSPAGSAEGFSSDDIFYIVDGDEIYTIHGDEIYSWPSDIPWLW